MSAYVADDASPSYVPPATDVMSTVLLNDAGSDGEESAEERVRRSFTNLREQIDAYAVGHKANVALTVKASPPSSSWWLLLLVGLALMD